MTNTNTIELTVVVTCDAVGAPVEEYDVRVELDGDVLALDPVSDTYGRAHGLAAEVVEEARRLAGLVRDGTHRLTAGYVSPLWSEGVRVEGGEGADRDTGTIFHRGGMPWVAWDSGVSTPAFAGLEVLD